MKYKLVPVEPTEAMLEPLIYDYAVGVLFNALPAGRRDLSSGTKTLLFEDGTGLTVSSNGTFWIDGPCEVKRAVAIVHEELIRNQRDLQDVLQAAGALIEGPE